MSIPRILFYTESGYFSGAERALASLAAEIQRDMHVAILFPGRLSEFHGVLENVADMMPRDLLRKTDFALPLILPWLSRRNYNSLLSAVDTFKPDILVFNQPDPEECLGTSMRIRRSVERMVGWVHTPQRLDHRAVKLGRMRSALCRKPLRSFDRLMLPGEGLASTFARDYGVSEEVVEALPNGIVPLRPIDRAEREAARHATGIAAGDVSLALIGRVDFGSKGHDILACALRKLGHSARRFTVTVAGEGEDIAALRDLASRTSANWHFPGWIGDVRTILAASDALVMPSRYEGLPLAALEAASAGVSVLLSPVGANRATFPESWIVGRTASDWAEYLNAMSPSTLPDSKEWWNLVGKQRHSMVAMAKRFSEIVGTLR